MTVEGELRIRVQHLHERIHRLDTLSLTRYRKGYISARDYHALRLTLLHTKAQLRIPTQQQLDALAEIIR